MNAERPERMHRMITIRRRLDKLQGFIKGYKANTSPAAIAEIKALRAEWDQLGEINQAETLAKAPQWYRHAAGL